MPLVSFTSLNSIQRSISLTSYKYDLHKPRENVDVILDINENVILDEEHLKKATLGQKKSFKRSISSILTSKTTGDGKSHDLRHKNFHRSKSLNYFRKVSTNDYYPVPSAGGDTTAGSWQSPAVRSWNEDELKTGNNFEYFQQPTWRLWGEEKVEGAIYTVYLKKVRYNTPSRSVTEDTEDHISHLEWETVRIRFVKAGTLEKLVESLASDTGELESTYINVFLATYRTFASAKQVLNLLTER